MKRQTLDKFISIKKRKEDEKENNLEEIQILQKQIENQIQQRKTYQPLAEKQRPIKWEDIIGQEDILGINTACSESNNHNTFEGTLANGFSTDIWGIRGIYDYPVIILPQNYSCSGGHTSDNTWVENKVMTCESNGERVQHCTVCGRVAKAEVIKTNGHNYDDFIIISGSKLIPPIVKERKCDVCGYVEQVTDWSYILITIIVGLVVIGVMIGLINYFRGLRRTRG